MRSVSQENLDRGRVFGLYSRPRSRFPRADRLSPVNKMFIIWPSKKNLIRLMYKLGLY